MSFWKDRSVLVTGCNGFVGSWLVKALVDGQAKVTGLIRDDLRDSPLAELGYLQRIDVVRGDVTDYEAVERAMNEYNIEVCFHLAAQSQVGVSNRSPLSTIRTNVLGTLNILESARNLGNLKAVVVASSDKAYGEHRSLPYREDFALKGTYPYDASKACTDILAQSYYNTYRLPVAIARCGNIFGPGDLNLKRIVPDTIRSLCEDAPPLIRSNGRYIRDYLFVEDAVAAYLSLGKALVERRRGVAGGAFNFGTGRPISVLQLVGALIKVSGRRLRPKILNTAKAEIRAQYLSSDKARRLLGWRPRHDLKSAVETTYEWYEKFFTEKR